MALSYWIGSDDLGREVVLPEPARRIVSLVPSITELAAALGAEVVGCTRFCVRPAGLWEKAVRVGGTKDVQLDRVRALQPDLILANEEENDREQVLALAREFPVYVTSVKDLTDNKKLVRRVGKLLGAASWSRQLLAQNAAVWSVWHLEEWPPLGVAYAIWRDPWMFAGGGTFIDAMLQEAGLVNVLAHMERYPTLEPERIRELKPEAVLLSSEPFPFGPRHLKEARRLFPDSRIILADGQAFSWYGLRPLSAVAECRRVRQELAKSQ